MAIIKATDFEKIQQNELTIDELKQKFHLEETYLKTQWRIKEKLIEADQAAATTMQEEIQLLQDKLNLVQNSLEVAEREITRLRHDLAENEEVARLQNKLGEKEALLENQAQQIAALQITVQEQTATISVLDTELTQTKTALQTAQIAAAREAELQAKTANQALTITNLENELKTTNETLARLSQENKVIKQVADTTAIRDNELERQVNAVKETNSLAAKENLTLRTNLQRTEQQVADLTGKIEKLQQEKAALSDTKEKAVQEMNRIIGSYSAEQEKNIQLEYKFKRAEQEFRDLQSELKIAKDTITSLEQQFCLPEKITKLLS